MIVGTVVRGDGVGKQLGYPTANLDVDTKKLSYSAGVYAARAVFDTVTYDAALVIDKERNKLEVYLFEYNHDDFYGETLSVEPIQKVSELEQWESEEALVAKINNDIAMIQQFLYDKRTSEEN
jgi:riboflavin kinase/FMN adenylyltransferase